MNLFYSNNQYIEKAYIMRINNKQSIKLSKKCAKSCEKIKMDYEFWEGYNGIEDDKSIIVPEHLKDDSFMSMLKVDNQFLLKGEVATALTHISLWAHCVKIQKPIVILEHDAIMIKKIYMVKIPNSIVYMGCKEWNENNDDDDFKAISPPLYNTGLNKRFMMRGHAYAIDPFVAKNFLAEILRRGIWDPIDVMIKSDLFNITQQGFFAYDDPDGTLVKNRYDKPKLLNDSY